MGKKNHKINLSMNNLKTNYPCYLKLWLMFFHHYLHNYAKNIFVIKG